MFYQFERTNPAIYCGSVSPMGGILEGNEQLDVEVCEFPNFAYLISAQQKQKIVKKGEGVFARAARSRNIRRVGRILDHIAQHTDDLHYRKRNDAIKQRLAFLSRSEKSGDMEAYAVLLGAIECVLLAYVIGIGGDRSTQAILGNRDGIFGGLFRLNNLTGGVGLLGGINGFFGSNGRRQSNLPTRLGEDMSIVQSLDAFLKELSFSARALLVLPFIGEFNGEGANRCADAQERPSGAINRLHCGDKSAAGTCIRNNEREPVGWLNVGLSLCETVLARLRRVFCVDRILPLDQ